MCHISAGVGVRIAHLLLANSVEFLDHVLLHTFQKRDVGGHIYEPDTTGNE